MTEEINVWAIDDENKATSLESKKRVDTEALLEEILVKNPSLLLPGLRLIGRQTPTTSGTLDLLGVDKDGKLVVFELKRGILAREAVAQVIDYASGLSNMDLESLASLIADHSGQYGIEKIEDFQEWYYSRDFESLEGLRPLRMCLVGLGADESTERMTTFLAENSGMDISLITFHGFERNGQTLLARRVQVEGSGKIGGPTKSGYLNEAERRARLETLVEDSGVPELFETVRKKFRECWIRSVEYINPGSIGIKLPEQTERGNRQTSFARIDPNQGKVRMIIYGNMLALCPQDFAEAKKQVPFQEYKGVSDPSYDELRFSINEAVWQASEDRLTALLQTAYKAWETKQSTPQI